MEGERDAKWQSRKSVPCRCRAIRLRRRTSTCLSTCPTVSYPSLQESRPCLGHTWSATTAGRCSSLSLDRSRSNARAARLSTKSLRPRWEKKSARAAASCYSSRSAAKRWSVAPANGSTSLPDKQKSKSQILAYHSNKTNSKFHPLITDFWLIKFSKINKIKSSLNLDWGHILAFL